ncbi:MAG: hypothetical protein IPJ89_01360 [Candidatus Iainarchaeum archaeon]|uniref:Protein-export membrane protein SecF n=1 Tax=Candidatus Iainarchaeum sp. TaxID=3101447 RepID=A0A7T9DK95_9ARCH|nr:MAG: hypothetical protein IPJ89_01360 [Candidatus Diapherotrites archaeon]
MVFQLYDKNYKRLMIIPAVLAIAFLLILLVFPGIKLGLDFVGGVRVVVNTDKLSEKPVQELLSQELNLKEVKVSVVTSPFGTSARIEYAEPQELTQARQLLDQALQVKATAPTQARSLLTQSLTTLNITPTSEVVDDLVTQASQAINTRSTELSNSVRQKLTERFSLPADTSFTIEEVTPTFGATFLSNAIFVGIISILLLTIVIFIFFREVVPSLAMIQAILFDMLTAVALTTLFGFSITLSSVAALLMLVGFSIDTDILLTTRALKRQDKTVLARMNESVMTGLTVTSTVMGASLVMLIVSYTAQISTIFEIAAIVFFGSIGDVIATYLMNGPILLWYWESKHGKVEA